MINIIVDLNDEQKEDVISKLGSLDHLVVCRDCNALIQFEESDINRTRVLPHIGCPCGNSVQLHAKYKRK